MIEGLKPYPRMKDSGVAWLGEVPEHWDVLRFKYLLRESDKRSDDGSEQLLRVSQFTGVTERKRSDGADEPDSRASSLVGYKLVEPNELVVNIMLAWNGSMGVSRFHGLTSPAYCVYRFDAQAWPWYFHYLLRSPVYKSRIKALSTGVVDSRLRLYTDDLYRLESLIPPQVEQAAIVRFLDHVDRVIRRYIGTKQKLIKLLEEQKQAIIHRAVTRGLDPDVRLKPSAVEWLGDVPEHWSVMPLKRAFTKIDYGISDSGSDDGTIPVLTMGNIRGGVVTVPVSGGVSSVDSQLLLEDRDLLFNRTNSAELVAKVGLFRSIGRPVTFASYLVRMRPSSANCPEFLNLVMNDPTFLHAARREAIPSLHQSNLNPTRYGRLAIALPPLQEQKDIIDALADDTSNLSEAIFRFRREIELFREYRTRLIADIVTGKLDVREAAARLPDECDNCESFDDSDDMIDTEEKSADEADFEEVEA